VQGLGTQNFPFPTDNANKKLVAARGKQRASPPPHARPWPAARRADCCLHLPRPEERRVKAVVIVSVWPILDFSALQPTVRDEQSSRKSWLGHGPDGRGSHGRGAEAQVAAMARVHLCALLPPSNPAA